jgi:hypothetical protein
MLGAAAFGIEDLDTFFAGIKLIPKRMRATGFLSFEMLIDHLCPIFFTEVFRVSTEELDSEAE